MTDMFLIQTSFFLKKGAKKKVQISPTFSHVINSLCNQSRGSFWEAGGSLSPVNFKKDKNFNCTSENNPTAQCLTQAGDSLFTWRYKELLLVPRKKKIPKLMKV